MRRFLFAAAVAGALAALVTACGGPVTGPSKPPPPPPPSNNLPVIQSITLQGSRPKEPPNFADVGETIVVTAKVQDDETPVDQLQYQWTASAGTFSGTGANVTWQAPASTAEPVKVTITLKVIEKYGYPGGPQAYEHDVTSAATLSLHDSTTEIGTMSRQFLQDFSDSNIDVSTVMRNFQPGCYGTKDETNQVAGNRKDYVILESFVGDARVILGFGTIGPYASQRGDAFAAVPVRWRSRRLKDNVIEDVSGTDWVAAFYYPDQDRWRLCDSEFQGHLTAGSTFIR
jgi:hypothetical protein